MKLLFSLLVFPLFLSAQFNPSTLLPNVIPTNPKAYEFLKYGDIPVGKYTGIPDISIPIHTIKAKGMEIPIALTYHSNGFKVSEESGWTGLGWTLQGGGSITQIVNGTDDFGRYRNRNILNFLQMQPNIPQGAIGTCTQFYLEATPNQSTYGSIFASYPKLPDFYTTRDNEPDVFKFSVAGYSGTFILDWVNENFVCITDSNIKIESANYNYSINGSSPTDFIIRVPDGHKFVFTIKEAGNYIVNRSGSDLWGGASGLNLIYDEEKAFRTYQISSIITNLGDIITYDYALTGDIKGYPTVSKQITKLKTDLSYVFFKGLHDYDITFSVLATSSKQSYLSSISYNGGLIQFFTSDRTDLVGAKKLDKIEISKKLGSLPTKSFLFNYSYFIGHVNGTNLDSYLNVPSVNFNKTANELSTRLKLNSLTEVGKPSYVFEYNENSLPKKTSLATDYWGYYNGYLGNIDVFPDLYSFNLQRDNLNFSTFAGNSKVSNLEATKSAVLKKIIYPTGGSSEFSYELNSFSNFIVPDTNQGVTKSIQISSVSSQFPTSTSIQIIEGGNTIFRGSGILSTRGCLPANPNAYANCYLDIKHFKKDLLTYIKNTPNLNSHLNTYGLPYVLGVDLDFLDGNPNNPSLFNQYYNPEASVTLRKLYNDPEEKLVNNLIFNLPEGIAIFEARGSCGVYNGTTNSSQATFTFTFREYKNITNTVSNAAGLRISNINNYTSSGVLAERKIFNYEGGKLMTPLVFANKSRYDHEEMYFYPDNINTGSAVNTDTGCAVDRFHGDKYTFYSSSIATLSTSASGSFVGYDKVTEASISKDYISGIANPTNGNTVSYFTNNPDISALGSGNTLYYTNNVTLPPVSATLDNGLKTQEVFFNKGGKIVRQIFNNYLPVINNICFYGSRSALNKVLLIDPTHCWPATDIILNIGAYPIISHQKSQLISSLDSSYLGTSNLGNEVSVVKTYQYDSHQQLSKVTESSSEGVIKEKEFKYPYDFNQIGDNMYIGMLNKNMITPIVETKTKVNLAFTSLERKTFKAITTNNLNQYSQTTYVPEKIKYSKSGNAFDLEDRVVFESYDDHANPTEVYKKDDTKTVYIWGYNKTLPIAKIDNITYNEVLSYVPNLQSISDSGTEENLILALNLLRNNLPNAMVTTYTYIPLVGVSSITDPKGDTITYTYDSFGRLQFVKDKNGNILSENQYNYKQ